mgnify:CR=1 FL=1
MAGKRTLKTAIIANDSLTQRECVNNATPGNNMKKVKIKRLRITTLAQIDRYKGQTLFNVIHYAREQLTLTEISINKII